MDRNPYSPPAAEVADTPSPIAARPRSVVIGVALAAATLVIGVLHLFASPAPGPLLIPVSVLVFLAALMYAVWAQRGWARWVFLALFVLGLPAIFFVRELLLKEGALAVAIMAVQTVLQVVALGYMFSSSSNAWFRSRRKQ